MVVHERCTDCSTTGEAGRREFQEVRILVTVNFLQLQPLRQPTSQIQLQPMASQIYSRYTPPLKKRQQADLPSSNTPKSPKALTILSTQDPPSTRKDASSTYTRYIPSSKVILASTGANKAAIAGELSSTALIAKRTEAEVPLQERRSKRAKLNERGNSPGHSPNVTASIITKNDLQSASDETHTPLALEKRKKGKKPSATHSEPTESFSRTRHNLAEEDILATSTVIKEVDVNVKKRKIKRGQDVLENSPTGEDNKGKTEEDKDGEGFRH